MVDKNVFKVIVVLLWIITNVKGQDNPDTCYGPGSIATTAILTFIVVLLTQFVAYTTWKRYWKNRQGKHEILNLDPEKGKSEFSYDNPGFKSEVVKNSSDDALVFDKSRQLSPLDALTTEKQKSSDDFDLKKPEIKTVLLKSRDFTGLGFDIVGNIRDGIFVKSILQRGPAYESRKLNLGDRIKNVTIDFEHIVYEDAVAILSYASPYEVILQTIYEDNDTNHTPTKTSRIGHPLFFKSPSFADLLQIGKNDKKAIPESPKTPTESPTKNKSPQSNKSKGWPNKIKEKLVTHENETTKPQSLESKFQKIGVRVLPMELKGIRTGQHSPKTAELSQNDNNINLEINLDKSIDEVDKTPKQEEIVNDSSIYRGGVNGSGIKRNKDGIPEEIPNFMLNAAVAARKNRKVIEINANNTLKSPKKQKGKAPAPPDEKLYKSDKEEPKNLNNSWEKEEKVLEAADYVSDSDAEIEHISVPTVIELDAIDVTIHQFEDNDEIQNRRTASTGDLTKIQNSVKNNTNSLERAQSLDITDSVLPKMLGNSEISDFISNKTDGFDGLRAFQSNRLVKSTEWGNLEDAVLDLVDSDFERQMEEENSLPDTPVTSNEETFTLPEESHPTEAGSSLVVEETKEVIFDPESLSKWLLMEKQASRTDSYYEPSKIYSVGNTNVSDDMKVSRHSLNGLEKINKVGENLEKSPENLKLTNNNKRNTYIYEAMLLQSPHVEVEAKGSTSPEKSIEVGTDPTSKPTYITEIQLLPVGNKMESVKTGNLENISSKLLLNQQIDPEKELHKIQEIAKLQLQKLPELRYSSSFESSDSNGVSQVSVVNTNQDTKVYPKAHCARSESNASLKSRIPVAMSKTPPTSPERRNSQNFDSDFNREIQFVSLPMQRSLSSSTITIHQKSPKNVTIQKIDFENLSSKSRSASIGKR